MTKHWVIGEAADAPALLALLAALRKEAVGGLETYTPVPVPGLDGPSGRLPAVALIGAFGGLALAPSSPVLALIAAPAFAALAVAVAVLMSVPKGRPFAPAGFMVSAVTAQGDVAEQLKARLEALGAKNVAIVIEASR